MHLMHLPILCLLKFNHHYDPEVAISYDEQGNCIAYTTRDVSAGSELRISYGFVTNPSALFGELTSEMAQSI